MYKNYTINYVKRQEKEIDHGMRGDGHVDVMGNFSNQLSPLINLVVMKGAASLGVNSLAHSTRPIVLAPSPVQLNCA